MTRPSPDRFRRIVSYGFLVSIVLAVTAAGLVTVFSREPLRACLRNAPGDLTDQQMALTSSTDYLHGTLECTWSGPRGASARHLKLSLYRWPIDADD